MRWRAPRLTAQNTKEADYGLARSLPVGAISGGTLSDVLLRRGFSKRFARARAPALCTLLGVPMIVIAALVLYFLVVPEPIERPEQVAELAGQGAQG